MVVDPVVLPVVVVVPVAPCVIPLIITPSPITPGIAVDDDADPTGLINNGPGGVVDCWYMGLSTFSDGADTTGHNGTEANADAAAVAVAIPDGVVTFA